MENQNLDSKKWKKRSAEFKQALSNSPKNEHTIYYVNFKEGMLEEKVDLSNQENVLDFNNKPEKKTRKRKPNEPKPS